MSLNNISSTVFPNTINGLTSLNASSITINGNPVISSVTATPPITTTTTLNGEVTIDATYTGANSIVKRDVNQDISVASVNTIPISAFGTNNTLIGCTNGGITGPLNLIITNVAGPTTAITGAANVCIAGAFANVTNGGSNVGIGLNSGSGVINGAFNICIGEQSGNGGTPLDNNIYIGILSVSSTNAMNEIVIGCSVTGNGDNTTTIGGNSIYLPASVFPRTGTLLLNGNPETTTQATSDNSARIATTAYVQNNLVNYATLAFLSNFLLLIGGTMTGTIAWGAPPIDSRIINLFNSASTVYTYRLTDDGSNGTTNWFTFRTGASGIGATPLLTVGAPTAFSTIVTAPTAVLGTNTTQIATTAFVQSAIGAISTFLPLSGGTMAGTINFSVDNIINLLNSKTIAYTNTITTSGAGGGATYMTFVTPTVPPISPPTPALITTEVPIDFRISGSTRAGVNNAGLYADSVNGFTILRDTTKVSLSVGVSVGSLGSVGSGTNIIFGYECGRSITTGIQNVIMGVVGTGDNITTGSYNTCIGYQAGRCITTGSLNTAIGHQALGSPTASTGNYNCAMGHYTFVGLTTGSFNTALGVGAGTGLTTGSFNCYIGPNAQPSGGSITNEIVIGSGITGNGSNTTTIAGNVLYCPQGILPNSSTSPLTLNSGQGANTNVQLIAGGTTGGISFWYGGGGTLVNSGLLDANGLILPSLAGTGTRTVLASSIGLLSAPVSDARLKTNIITLPSVLSNVVALHPITYNWNPDSDMVKHPLYDESIQYGFTAQDVQAQFPDFVYDLTIAGSDTHYFGFDERKFTPVLIKAIQEQNEMIVAQQTEITNVKTQFQEQNEMIVTQKNQIQEQQATIQAMAQHITTLTKTLNQLLERYPL